MNWQNFPRDSVVKQAIVPKRGAFSELDFSQIEPRLLGYFTAKALRDYTIVNWYKEGRDFYTNLAAQVHVKTEGEVTKEERQQAKTWFLMILYGGGPRKIGASMGMPYDEALKFYKQFHAGLPMIRALSNPKPRSERAMKHWQPGAIEGAYERKGYLKTPHGMHLHAEPFGEFKLLNKLIQGSAAGVMKAALIRVDAWLQESGVESRMVSTIHDSILMDGPESELPILHEHIPELMREDWLTEVIPIEVDHDVSTTTWAAKIPYDEWKETSGHSHRQAT